MKAYTNLTSTDEGCMHRNYMMSVMEVHLAALFFLCAQTMKDVHLFTLSFLCVQAVKDVHLFGLVGALILIDVIILTCWMIFDRQTLHYSNSSEFEVRKQEILNILINRISRKPPRTRSPPSTLDPRPSTLFFFLV